MTGRYDQLPEHMREVARDYVERHRRPGDFLAAVLSNDLTGAFSKADVRNIVAMRAWASWLYNEAPAAAWGSKAVVDAWVKEDTDGE